MRKTNMIITAISAVLALACISAVVKPIVGFASSANAEESSAFVEVYEKGGDKTFAAGGNKYNYVDELDGKLPEFAQWDESDAFVIVYEHDDSSVPAQENNTKFVTHYLRETKDGSIPTAFWNLDTLGTYQYALISVKRFVNTDFCFNCDTEGYIAMSMGNLDSNGKDIRISIINSSTGNVVSSWIGDPESIAGLGWGGLSEFRTYYFKFEAYKADEVSGTGLIMHD